MKNRIVLVFSALMIGLFFVRSSANAAVNEQIPFQGKLTNASGVSVSDGDYDIVFKLYTVSFEGTAIWTGTHTTANGNAVTVTDGIFDVMLGSGTGNSLGSVNFNQTLYLGITVESDAEMTPRKPIGAVPQSIVSKYLQTASGSGAAAGTGAGNVLLLDGSGNIGISGSASVSTATFTSGYTDFTGIASAPSTSGGRLYYNSTDGNLYLYDGVGAGWVDLTGSGFGGFTDIDTDYGAETVASVWTLSGNWINTANPWADNEVIDDLTVASTKNISTTGSLSVGTSATGAKLQIQNEASSGTLLGLTLYGTASNGAQISVSRARGTTGAPQVVSAGDLVGGYYASAYDGTIFQSIGGIRHYVDSVDGGTGDVASYIKFETSNSSGSVSEVMRLDPDGDLGLGVTNPQRRLHINGAIRLNTISAPSSPVSGDVYSSGTALYYYNGSAWVDLTATGTAGAKTDTIMPEFSNAVLTSSRRGAAPSGNNTGVLLSDDDYDGGSYTSHSYYQFESSEASLQDYYIKVNWTLPVNFSSWSSSNAIRVNYLTESSNYTNNDVEVYAYLDGSQYLYSSSNPSDIDNASTTWSTTIIDDSLLVNADTAGEVIVLYIRLESKSSYYARVGEITFSYNTD